MSYKEEYRRPLKRHNTEEANGEGPGGEGSSIEETDNPRRRKRRHEKMRSYEEKETSNIQRVSSVRSKHEMKELQSKKREWRSGNENSQRRKSVT